MSTVKGLLIVLILPVAHLRRDLLEGAAHKIVGNWEIEGLQVW